MDINQSAKKCDGILTHSLTYLLTFLLGLLLTYLIVSIVTYLLTCLLSYSLTEPPGTLGREQVTVFFLSQF